MNCTSFLFSWLLTHYCVSWFCRQLNCFGVPFWYAVLALYMLIIITQEYPRITNMDTPLFELITCSSHDEGYKGILYFVKVLIIALIGKFSRTKIPWWLNLHTLKTGKFMTLKIIMHTVHELSLYKESFNI